MILTFDAETYFDDEFTLSKLTTEAYVRDPRFEVHGAAVKWGPDGATTWYTHDFLKGILPEIVKRPDFDGFLCHHAHFDGLILSHVYQVKPKFWFDTLSMARMLIGNHLSVSLENLLKHFGLPSKTIDYNMFRGKHWHELTPAEQQQLGEGASTDADRTWDIFCKLAAQFPQEEYAVIDSTLRLFTEPCLVGDTQLLGQIWQEEQEAKAALLAELGVTKKDLGSAEKFADLLRAEGVEPETKAGKNGPIFAFAKTDDFMRDLVGGEDERVAMLAQARLETKSNGVQTRSERLGWMSTRGAMPVYLLYCGAHTTRWSGGDKVNWQNLKRGGPIAKAIRAPEGHMLVINDASQIECRILNMVAGQHDVIARFRNHEDPYIALASAFYGRPITKADEKERGTGKQGELSCGYGAGGPTIKATAKKGTYGPPVYLTDEQALTLRDLYRATHTGVTGLWQEAGAMLNALSNGANLIWRDVVEIKDKRIWLPNGAPLNYETLEWYTPPLDVENVNDKTPLDGSAYWRLKTRRGWSKLYGAKLVENLIQALARVHVSQAWLRCRQAGIRVVSMEHDKLIACVSAHEAEDALAYMKQEMSREPVWLPGIPLDSEGYVSETFAK